MKIVISGAGGFVGGALVKAFSERGAVVTSLVRRPPSEPDRERRWAPTAGELDEEILTGVEAVINLNGRNISRGRWTTAVKDELRSSRLESTRTIVQAIKRSTDPPPILVNASATGIYGDRADEPLDESSAPGEGFLTDLARDWEAAALEARSSATRVVPIRLGMVLGDGGALGKMLTPFKLGFGGPMGGGRQWWPWIAMDDVIGAVDHILTNEGIDGPVNLVAPGEATSKTFARALGEHLGIMAVVPAPAFAIKLALGEMAQALLLASTRARPGVLEDSGFRFRAPTLADAFQSILG